MLDAERRLAVALAIPYQNCQNQNVVCTNVMSSQKMHAILCLLFSIQIAHLVPGSHQQNAQNLHFCLHSSLLSFSCANSQRRGWDYFNIVRSAILKYIIGYHTLIEICGVGVMRLIKTECGFVLGCVPISYDRDSSLHLLSTLIVVCSFTKYLRYMAHLGLTRRMGLNLVKWP